MQHNRPAELFLWAVMAAWTGVTLLSFYWPETLSNNDARYINVFLLSVFTLVHGSQRYGTRVIIVYFVIGVVVTNVTENMSIVTGFPFGQYHHAAAMGPKIWHVPIIVGPIFTVVGYLSWVLAGIVLTDVFSAARSGVAVMRPLIAAFMTTSWDLCVDAIGGTFNRDWVWAEGGPWFGVPWLNFFGWMLTMWLIFQLFAYYLSRTDPPRDVAAGSRHWTQAIVFWFLFAMQFVLLATIVPDTTITDPTGRAWQTAELFQSMALASVFTLLFTAVLAAAVLHRARRSSVNSAA